ncbi:MAG: GAF domain-containing protein [Burkholderiales bacterium]|nr:GAF domain-containing protein [Burkholderiales bacterium]
MLCTPLSLHSAELAWENLAETTFSHFDVDNGLPHAVATSIAQDREGFLWVGTQGGLARWDGYRFRVFAADARSSTSLPDDLIQVLHLDQRGQLWIGSTSGGLSRYDAINDRFSTISASAQGLSNSSVYALVDDGAGGLWIGTQGGLNHLAGDGKTIRRWLHDDKDPNSLPDQRISSLLRTKQGQLWLGTGRGLAKMEGEKLVPQALLAPGESQPDIRALWQAPDGKLWIGTRQGAYIFDPASGKVQNLQQLIPHASLGKAMINNIVAVSADEVWLSSANHGIFAISLKNLTLHHIFHDPSTPTSLADDAVQAMFQDHSGLVWVAGLRGLSRHDPHQHGLLNLVGNPNLPGKIGDRDIWSILVAKDGSIWLGLGANGVDVLHPQMGVVQSLRPDPKKPNNTLPQTQVLALAEWGPHIYIGTNRGLYRHLPGSKEVELLALPPRKTTRSIKTLFAEDDKIWLGSTDGMWIIPAYNGEIASDSHAELASFSPQLSDQRIASFAKDKAGQLWIGTWNGLNQVNPATGKLEQILADNSRSDGLSHGFITSILCDQAGRIWVGTSGGGVNLWLGRNEKGQAIFRHFNLSNGLPNAIVNQLLQDAQGNIWVSTDGGLARIAHDTLAVQAWRRADGVQFATYWANSGAVNKNGELLFGAAGGLTVLQPERLLHWDYRPRIVVTDVRVGGKVVATGALNLQRDNSPEILVTAQANSLAVEFAALDFSAPEKNRYFYQLVGFDPNWMESDASRRLAAYTNLPPGQYTLRLRGSNRDGLATTNELAIPVTVLPDWYQTWWFRLLLVASGAGAVFALIHVRTQYLHLQKQALAEEVAARTNEISQQQSTLLATNLELHHANQELANSATTLRELGQIGREITANLEFEAMFAALHLHIRKLLDAPALSIYIADYGKNELQFSFGRLDNTVLPASSISFDSPTSFSARCARERQEILVELEEGQTNPNPIPNTRNMLTLLFGPLIVDQHLLGVMSIQSDKVRAFGERERMIFRTLCSYAAIALENGVAYRQLQEAQDMLVAQEKLAALGGLVAGVAHELNTPLGNGIMMASSLQDNIDLLLEKLRNNRLHRNELEDYLQDAQEAAQVLMRNLRNSAQLVNSFKQVAVDRTSVQRRVFDLRLTSLEVLATLINQVKSQGLEIDCDIAPDIVLDSYPGPYGQVLANLVNNSLMHAFEGCSGGKMQLSAKRKEAGRVLITFCDDGIGIAECDLKHIFDPFFTTKMGQGGKGLGLSVCYNIVTSILGGQIRVSSNRAHGDAGTCFTLDLPLVAQA